MAEPLLYITAAAFVDNNNMRLRRRCFFFYNNNFKKNFEKKTHSGLDEIDAILT